MLRSHIITLNPIQDPLQLEKREGLKDEGDLMFKLDCIQQQQDKENNRLVYIVIL